MAATLGSLAEGILDQLYGLNAVQDAVTYLSAPLDGSALTASVEDVSEVGAGLIEIDTELIRVKSVDFGSGALALGRRGVKGTTAASHATGAEVRVNPVVPYNSVIRELNAEVSSLFPYLCEVATTEFSSSTTSIDYEIPVDAEMILDVRQRDRYGDWRRVRHWEVEHGQNETDFPSGRTLRIAVPDDCTIRVVYGKRFGQFAALTDTLASVGVPESCEDLIRMGAALRLLPSLDLARYTVTSNQSADTSNKSPQPGTGVMVAREIKALYRERREQEVNAFRRKFPSRVHYTR